MTHLETVTVAVFLITPTLVTIPFRLIGGMVLGSDFPVRRGDGVGIV